MRMPSALGVLLLLTSGCAASVANRGPAPSRPSNNVALLADGGRARIPRGLTKVPPGHYPSPGECRIWFVGRPPGRQPAPTPCEALHGRVPAGTFVLFGSEPWDTEYDWAWHERERPGSVPDTVLRLMMTVQMQD